MKTFIKKIILFIISVPIVIKDPFLIGFFLILSNQSFLLTSSIYITSCIVDVIYIIFNYMYTQNMPLLSIWNIKIEPQVFMYIINQISLKIFILISLYFFLKEIKKGNRPFFGFSAIMSLGYIFISFFLPSLLTLWHPPLQIIIKHSLLFSYIEPTIISSILSIFKTPTLWYKASFQTVSDLFNTLILFPIHISYQLYLVYIISYITTDFNKLIEYLTFIYNEKTYESDWKVYMGFYLFVLGFLICLFFKQLIISSLFFCGAGVIGGYLSCKFCDWLWLIASNNLLEFITENVSIDHITKRLLWGFIGKNLFYFFSKTSSGIASYLLIASLFFPIIFN